MQTAELPPSRLERHASPRIQSSPGSSADDLSAGSTPRSFLGHLLKPIELRVLIFVRFAPGSSGGRRSFTRPRFVVRVLDAFTDQGPDFMAVSTARN